uniref:Putative secreted protein n=1 Tax=Amblyomma parvum TaxID=251391 RepID=A0A023FZ58_AMBPA
MKSALLCMLLLLTFIIASQCQTPRPSGRQPRYKKRDGNNPHVGRPGPVAQRVNRRQTQQRRAQLEENIRQLSQCVGECHPDSTRPRGGCGRGCICTALRRGAVRLYECFSDVAGAF